MASKRKIYFVRYIIDWYQVFDTLGIFSLHVNAPTCVSIQPKLVHLFIHDCGVANKYIKLYRHLRSGRVRVQHVSYKLLRFIFAFCRFQL